jgi:NADH-quinone oxidoreductase subunit F
MSATFPGRRLRARAARRRLAGRDGAARLLVGAGGCGEAVGAAVILAALRREVERRGERVAVAPAGCGGMCHDAAQVTLQRPGRPDVTWGRVSADQARTLVAIAAGELAPAAVPNGFAWSAEPVDGLDGLSRVPFLAGQRRLLLDRVGRVDPVDLDEALDHGVYSGLAAALARPPEAVVEEVRRSGLAGRGGAYFPVATKWEACRRFRGPRSLVVNAEEGEPGVFKDRHLLEGDPHRVIEGALIAAYAVGAERIVVYVNGQARLARGRLEAALARARRRGLLGTGILGAPFACDVEVREGAGGYVLGEESVILESVEGNRPMPRVRPPYPVEEGLWGQPTAINNVETLANVPLIIERGADWFAALGSARFPGTKLVCISGDVARPGVVEVEIGLALGRVLDDLAWCRPNSSRRPLSRGSRTCYSDPATSLRSTRRVRCWRWCGG